MQLPKFKYFEDPYSDSAQRQFKPSEDVCACCDRPRGWVYTQWPHGADVDARICPWCIADGSAFAKFGVEFVAVYNIPDEVASGVDELGQRTPAYSSWQEEVWRAHCGEPCCFIGDGSPAKARTLESELSDTLDEIAEAQRLTRAQVIEKINPPGPYFLYLFRCVRCGKHLASWDTD